MLEKEMGQFWNMEYCIGSGKLINAKAQRCKGAPSQAAAKNVTAGRKMERKIFNAENIKERRETQSRLTS